MSRLSLTTNGGASWVSVTTETEPHPVDFTEADACRILLSHERHVSATRKLLGLLSGFPGTPAVNSTAAAAELRAALAEATR